MTRFIFSIFVTLLAVQLYSAEQADSCHIPRDAQGHIQRSRMAVAAFRSVHPCPSTGEYYGSCPGWQVDHIVPLCACGKDAADNMQWLTVQAHKAKTRHDVRVVCAG